MAAQTNGQQQLVEDLGQLWRRGVEHHLRSGVCQGPLRITMDDQAGRKFRNVALRGLPGQRTRDDGDDFHSGPPAQDRRHPPANLPETEKRDANLRAWLRLFEGMNPIHVSNITDDAECRQEVTQ